MDRGKSVDTSLGYGTSEGILMGTRSGNLDPSVMIYLMEQYKDPATVNDVVHKKSGVQGINGISSDLRDIEEEAEKGSPGPSWPSTCSATASASTWGPTLPPWGASTRWCSPPGIGENSTLVREKVSEGLGFLGAHFDPPEPGPGQEAEINTPESPVKILVVPTNEELVIAQDTRDLVTGR